MTLKITSPALETVFVDELPPFLKEERDKFIKRNRISGKNYCPWCLKAYLIEKAAEKGMEEWAISAIKQFLHCRKGHSGYYLDNEEVKIISN
jgi:hypothetical protein